MSSGEKVERRSAPRRRTHRRRPLLIAYGVVILIGLASGYAAKTAQDTAQKAKANTHHIGELARANRDLLKRVDAETKSLADAQITLARQQKYLCVKLKRGRAVVKTLADANGHKLGAQVTLVRCPPPVRPKPAP